MSHEYSLYKIKSIHYLNSKASASWISTHFIKIKLLLIAKNNDRVKVGHSPTPPCSKRHNSIRKTYLSLLFQTKDKKKRQIKIIR